MRVYGTIVGAGNQPLAAADILVYEGNTTLFSGESGEDGRFDFSNAGDYTGRLLKAVASRDGYDSAEQLFRPEGNQAILAFALKPLQGDTQGYFQRSKKVWRRFGYLEIGVLLLGFFGHHDISELVMVVNPLLILLTTCILFAKWPTYIWTGALLTTSAHLLNFLPLLSSLHGRVSSSTGTRVVGYYCLVVAALNFLFLLICDRYRSRLSGWPLIGALVRPERVQALQWALEVMPWRKPPKI